jgi:hypothetical protein
MVQQIRAVVKTNIKAIRADHIAQHQCNLSGLASPIIQQRYPNVSEECCPTAILDCIDKQFRCLQQREQRKWSYRKASNQTALARVDVPSGDTRPFPDPDPKTWSGPWTSISDPTEIAHHVGTANIQQYNQAANIPFASPPLESYLDRYADQPGSSSLSLSWKVSFHQMISSSPSSRHIGHYKGACEDDILTSMHSSMMSLPYQHGFSPSHWHKITDVMLE